MILLLDNYDSFTWNIVQALEALGTEVDVRRSDSLSVGDALALAPRAVVLGPGPGRPRDAGITLDLLRRAPDELAILGVCLGHQALVEALGGTIERGPEPVHGRVGLVEHDGDALFEGLPNPFPAGRYHSLCARRDAMPAELRRTGWTADGVVMAVRHTRLPRWGVQFHPDSMLTPGGPRILANFLALAGIEAHGAQVSGLPIVADPR